MLSILRRQVGAKIILGYMITLSLMLGVGLLAIARLDRINTTVNDLTNNLTLDMKLADEMVSQILLSRFYANRYITTQSQADLDHFNVEFSALQALLPQADQQITNPKRVEILRRIKLAVKEHEAAFGQASQIIKRRQTIQAQVLDVQGLVIENELSALRIYISTLDDHIVFFSHDNAQNAYQQMRLNLLKYLEGGDERYAVLFDKSYQEGQEAFDALESRLSDPAQIKNCADAKAALQAYDDGFSTIQTDYVAMKALTDGKLDAFEQEITSGAYEIASSIEQDFRAENEFSRRLVAATRSALLITTVLAVLIGLGLGLIVSRGITGPLQQVMRTSQQIAHVDLEALSSQLAALAQGDLRLSLDITAQPLTVQSEDEVGQMAQAFNEIISRLHQAGQTFKSTADYLNEMAGAAQAVAQGNLNVTVAARSETDVLGHAVTRMIANLRKAEEQVQRQLERLEALREIDTLITTSYDLPATLNTLLRHLTVQLQADAAAILLLDTAAGRLDCLAAIGLETVPAPLAVNDRCVRKAVLEGRPIQLNHLESPLNCLRSTNGQEFNAYYGLPLIAQGETKGVLQVFGHTPFGPEPAWTDFLDTLAGQAAIAIHNVELVRNLEDRVAARTNELQQRAVQMLTAAQVSHATSSVLDLDVLLQQSVNLIRERFGLYYVGLFLVDERREYGWLRAGTGEAGQHMLAHGHKLALDETSMIGWSVQNAQARIALDVGEEAVRFNNPWLPGTRSEMALPLIARGEVIGALSVQSSQPRAFNEADITVLQTMTDQLANAISNARLYTAAQQELAERKRTEERLLHFSAELEQSNEELRRFTYIVSHDLRAPLVNLKGFAAELRTALETIQAGLQSVLPQMEEQHKAAVAAALQQDVPEALIFIDSSVTRMDHFINALLKLSRLGRSDLIPGKVDMNALVQETLETLAHRIEQGGVQVRIAPLPEVVADRIAMEQIMSNILNNAVIYLDPDRPGEIEITGEHNDEVTTFHVRDNGRGIAPDDMDKVFAPFRRAGKQDVPGEGMGLAYVQTLVRRHGGQIWYESKLNEGTTFTFTISDHLAKGD